MSTQVVERKDVGKVEDILGDVIAEMPAEPLDSVPEGEGETVAEVVGKVDYSPLGNEKILNRVRSLHNALMKISGVDFWRNDGSSKYLAYFVPPKRSIFGIHLAKNRARGTLKRASEDGKKNLGDIGVKIRENGLFLDDESITQKDLLKKIVAYRRARGWD